MSRAPPTCPAGPPPEGPELSRDPSSEPGALLGTEGGQRRTRSSAQCSARPQRQAPWGVKKALLQMEAERSSLEQKAKESLQRALQERLQLQSTQRSLALAEQKCEEWKCQCEALKEDCSSLGARCQELESRLHMLQSKLQIANSGTPSGSGQSASGKRAGLQATPRHRKPPTVARLRVPLLRMPAA
ncbi:TRAF3-interacting JNK-activating modulator isoform X5 [Erinaceus europaeus]|uniref:TRAF3-interacting JNK-activating modulator isoform X5 n=1 Tax=Erinaceus europaeus TaxID=9365 RepID=A0ABM3WCK4_ERIEU|nr:TRAF3-interacting JNK-activating modulator isoform X5 [Erinaceus europaeus]